MALRLLPRRLLPTSSIISRSHSTLSHLPVNHSFNQPPPPPPEPSSSPLSALPTSSLLRTLFLHTITNSPTLFATGSKLLLSTADTIDHLPPLKYLVDKTFYAHFCAGSTPSEISTTVSSLRRLGYSGIILAYAREVEVTDTPHTSSSAIQEWLSGTLQTISLTTPGDLLAIKLTGAGIPCLPLLLHQRPCTDVPELQHALDSICAAARERGVGLLIDAEQARLQKGIDKWALFYMRKYNRGPRAVVFNTYQMYLKRSPAVLREHVKLAEEEGWRLGVKLVRGAYLGSDPRELIHPTKRDTDMAYDEAAEFLVSRGVDMVVASHNKESVGKVLRLLRRGEVKGDLMFAQLMGMADELSLALVREEGTKVLKYAVWGSTGECVKYLLRRAEENKDAVGRSDENYRAAMDELKHRFFSSV